MRLAGDVREIHNGRTGRPKDTDGGAWIMRWDVRGATGLLCQYRRRKVRTSVSSEELVLSALATYQGGWGHFELGLAKISQRSNQILPPIRPNSFLSKLALLFA